MTSGPPVALQHVHAGDPQAHDLRRLHRDALGALVELDRPRRCRRGARWSGTRRPGRWRRIAATTRSPTTKARMSRPLLSSTKRWMRTFCLVLCSVSITASATLVSGARITPMPWVPSSSLITTGAPPTRSMAGSTSARSAHEGGRRDADVVTRQDLDGAQLVARVGDAGRGVGRVDVHLLELADDRHAVERDRGADPRQDGVVVRQRACRGTAGRARRRRGRWRSAGC